MSEANAAINVLLLLTVTRVFQPKRAMKFCTRPIYHALDHEYSVRPTKNILYKKHQDHLFATNYPDSSHINKSTQSKATIPIGIAA